MLNSYTSYARTLIVALISLGALGAAGGYLNLSSILAEGFFSNGGELNNSSETRTEPLGINCAPLPSGAVAWWKGQNDANDVFGVNHGTLENGATFAPGRVGQAFSFDGVDDLVSAPDNPILNITGDLTIEGWINPTTVGGQQRVIVNKRNFDNSNVTYAFFVDTNGQLAYYAKTGGSFQYARSKMVIPTNVFTHVATTISGSTITLFINGVADGSTTLTVGRPATSGRLSIGHGEDVTNADDYFAGVIDELSLYSRSLSSGEIQAIYNAGIGGKCGTECTPLPSNAVAWWKGEDDANDVFGVNHGSLENGATFAPGRVGQAFSFDGVDDLVNVPNSASLDLQTAITLEAWFKTSNPTPSATKLIAGKILGYQIVVLPNGQMRFTFPIGGGGAVNQDIDSVSILSADTFTHLVGTYDAPTGLVKIYVNGVLENTLHTSGNIDSINNPFQIGGFTNFPVSFFNGVVDEVSLYNRALSASEIQAIFNAGSAGKCETQCAPVPANATAWWKGENDANDVFGANNGTLRNGATFAAGMVGQAFSFDGTDDFVEVDHQASLNPGSGSFTVETWVNQSGVGTFGDQTVPFLNKVATDFGNGWFLGVTAPAFGSVYLFQIQSGADPIRFVSTPGSAVLNSWVHVAGVYDAEADLLQIYTNGELRGTTNGVSMGPIDPVDSLLIGKYKRFSLSRDEYLPGRLDEPTLYNRALSASEIQAIFNAGSAGKCLPSGTPTPTPTPTATPMGFEADVTPRAAGDGVVISGDVIQMRRFATGLDMPSVDPNEFQRADTAPRATFGDGVINAGDVIQARRYATALDPATPAAGPTGSAPVPDPAARATRGKVHLLTNRFEFFW
ncbi:MAG: LamG domain-containing protein [Pyrinomonadaceae bacterium]